MRIDDLSVGIGVFPATGEENDGVVCTGADDRIVTISSQSERSSIPRKANSFFVLVIEIQSSSTR